MKLLKLIVVLLFISSSCSDTTNNKVECKAILAEPPIGSELLTSGLEEIRIEGDCLIFRQGVSGCDDDHSLNLVAVGDPASILINVPYYQVLVSVYDSNPQDCEAYFFLEEVSFDLTTLSLGNDNSLKLIFPDHDQSIIYER